MPPAPTNLDALLDEMIPNPEQPHNVPPQTTEALGHTALNEMQIDDAYITEGLKQLGEHANGEPVPEDTRISNRDEAHQAAFQEEIARVYDTAKIENKIYDVYDEAKREHEAFKAKEADEAANKPETETAEATESAPEPNQNQAATAPTPEASQAPREEAAAILSELGGGQLPPGSTVTKVDGNLFILDGANAKVITHSFGSPKVIDFHYDKATGTVTINEEPFSVVDNTTKYKETSLQNWQTDEKVVTLLPQVEKLFGIKRVVAVK